ncbi:MAG TPA: hypothetical protein VIN08_08010 [Ohtaekwangia sp.]|uniref:hypothetical protein n=1 Tax=Ohtaekwangia sp. TaxID=2066019 RepID=UPI002F92D62E
MATQKDDLYYHKILTFYNISPTPIKIEVLRGIYTCKATFDEQHLRNALEKNETYISQNSLTIILRLYIKTHLLVKVKQANADRDTEKSYYALSGNHILLIPAI